MSCNGIWEAKVLHYRLHNWAKMCYMLLGLPVIAHFCFAKSWPRHIQCPHHFPSQFVLFFPVLYYPPIHPFLLLCVKTLIFTLHLPVIAWTPCPRPCDPLVIYHNIHFHPLCRVPQMVCRCCHGRGRRLPLSSCHSKAVMPSLKLYSLPISLSSSWFTIQLGGTRPGRCSLLPPDLVPRGVPASPGIQDYKNALILPRIPAEKLTIYLPRTIWFWTKQRFWTIQVMKQFEQACVATEKHPSTGAGQDWTKPWSHSALPEPTALSALSFWMGKSKLTNKP